jgi:hypothetical protein
LRHYAEIFPISVENTMSCEKNARPAMGLIVSQRTVEVMCKRNQLLPSLSLIFFLLPFFSLTDPSQFPTHIRVKYVMKKSCHFGKRDRKEGRENVFI